MRELRVVYRSSAATRGIRAGVLRSPHDAGRVLAQILGDETVEVFGVLLVDIRKRVLAWHEVARGSLDGIQTNGRDVFKAAVLANAAAVVVAHSHPSGDPTPSPEDWAATSRLREAGELLGVEVLDHVIVGNRRYCSLRESTDASGGAGSGGIHAIISEVPAASEEGPSAECGR